LEGIVAKSARFSVVISTPAASADRAAHDHAASNVFISVVIFSFSGLLLSLLALMLGVPQVFD
jgi:hypothetical protein